MGGWQFKFLLTTETAAAPSSVVKLCLYACTHLNIQSNTKYQYVWKIAVSNEYPHFLLFYKYTSAIVFFVLPPLSLESSKSSRYFFIRSMSSQKPVFHFSYGAVSMFHYVTEMLNLFFTKTEDRSRRRDKFYCGTWINRKIDVSRNRYITRAHLLSIKGTKREADSNLSRNPYSGR